MYETAFTSNYHIFLVKGDSKLLYMAKSGSRCLLNSKRGRGRGVCIRLYGNYQPAAVHVLSFTLKSRNACFLKAFKHLPCCFWDGNWNELEVSYSCRAAKKSTNESGCKFIPCIRRLKKRGVLCSGARSYETVSNCNCFHFQFHFISSSNRPHKLFRGCSVKQYRLFVWLQSIAARCFGKQ